MGFDCIQFELLVSYVSSLFMPYSLPWVNKGDLFICLFSFYLFCSLFS